MIATLGIDPGVSGGLVLLHGDGRVAYIQAFRPSMTHPWLIDVLRASLGLLSAEGSSFVVIEKVGVMPKDGKKGANTFGRVDGLLRGGVLMAGYSIFDVYPMAWQAALDCLTGGNKNISKAKAKELWPGEKWTHATADAALIAEYGRRRMVL